MSRLRRVAQLLVLIVAAYAAVVLLVYLFQDRLIFVGAGLGRGQPLPDVPGVGVERLPLPAGSAGSDPRSFRIAVAEVDGATDAIVFFVGNGEDLRSGVGWAGLWADYGLNAVVVEYPGYGDSDGSPTVGSFEAAARVAAARARLLVDPARGELVAGGSSLGTFSATWLAAEGLVDRLFLRAPPTTLADAGAGHYPWLPVRWFLKHRFDNVALAPRIACPVLIVHGDEDRIVPLDHGRAVAAALGDRAELIVAERYGHNDLPVDRHSAVGPRIEAFLRRH